MPHADPGRRRGGGRWGAARAAAGLGAPPVPRSSAAGAGAASAAPSAGMAAPRVAPRAALGTREVEAVRAIVAVDADEVRRVTVPERRPPVAHLVALGRLDLDHLGAEVAEELGAVRPAQDAAVSWARRRVPTRTLIEEVE